MRLEGKTVVVTGASSGMGKAIVELFVKEGANVVAVARRMERLEELAGALKDAPGRVLPFRGDMSRAEDNEAMIDAAVKEFGRLDVLVNNAGVTRDNLLLRMSEEDYDRVLDTNLKGAVFCCKAVARPMMRQRYGRIVNLSSVVGLRGNAGQVNYSASKAGLIGLTKSLAKELASRGVTAHAVAPGFIETDMTNALPEAARSAMAAGIPARRPGLPEEVARAVAFFAREDAGYITGQVLCVDGGMAV